MFERGVGGRAVGFGWWEGGRVWQEGGMDWRQGRRVWQEGCCVWQEGGRVWWEVTESLKDLLGGNEKCDKNHLHYDVVYTLEVPNLDFHQIPMTSKLYSIET